MHAAARPASSILIGLATAIVVTAERERGHVDDAPERLVQLSPFAFWQESAMVVGVVIVVLAVGLAAVAGRRSAPRSGQLRAGELASVAGTGRT